MSDRLRNIGCLICGNKESQGVFPGRRDALEQKELGSYFSSSRVQAIYGQIVRCARCGFVFANPQPSPIELERIYQGLVDEAYASEEHARIVAAQRLLRVVEKWHPHRGMLLDVGCSTGIFLQCSERSGWKSLGVEPSSWALAQCRKRGLMTYQGVVESIALAPKTFDIVTMWDVLEHTVDPRGALKSVHQTMKNKGLLFINVPNIESMAARLLKQHWPLLLLEHLWYFSPSTLGSLLDKNGFNLLAIQPHRVTFSLGFVLTRLIQQDIFPPALKEMVASHKLLRRLHISFTMGEMTVIAQKI